jgi:hypothetical protein
MTNSINIHNSRNSTTRSWRTRRAVMLALVLVGAFAAGGVSAFADQQPTTDEPAIPMGAAFTAWTENGADGKIVLQLFKGDMPAPAAIVAGTVKTDTNCMPDSRGLSHCHNVIAIDDGGSIEAIHVHAMGRHPCLFPGQRVSLSRLDADWFIATQPK